VNTLLFATLKRTIKSKGRPSANRTHRHDVSLSDDLDIRVCDLKSLKMNLRTKNEVSRSRFSKVRGPEQEKADIRERTYYSASAERHCQQDYFLWSILIREYQPVSA